MSASDEPIFSNKDEEILYWKHLAAEYLQDAQRIQKESDEFIVESQQLDREYEATIDQDEKKIRELTLANNKAQNEIESLRNKLEQSNKEIGSLQNEVQNIKTEKLQMSQYIRDLEQKNDDLERARRIIEESIAGIETAFNSAVERNAILESEVDEKEGLKEKLQRLADETRDLKQELSVKEKERGPDNERILNGFQKAIMDSNRLKENETQTTPAKRKKKFDKTLKRLITLYNRIKALPRGLERRLEKSKYDYRDLSTNDNIRRSRSSTKNSPSPSLQGVTK
uniref:Nuclear distribution protein nudE homolog n=1 Tax=Diabrotica virgifera virgifera TaxID=50390 RepID=A0A6P7FEK4_DIAVI